MSADMADMRVVISYYYKSILAKIYRYHYL